MGLLKNLTVGFLVTGALISEVLPAIALPGTVTTRSNLRRGASLQSPVEEILPLSSPVEVMNIIRANDGYYWYYVQPKVEGTLSGWIRSDLVSVELKNKRYATIAGKRGEKVNVRLSPNLTSNVIYSASVGDLVTVEDSHKQFAQSRWYHVTFSNNVNGWVREDLLSIWPKGCVITCPEY